MKKRKGVEKRGGMSLACPFLHSWSALLGHDGGDWCRCYPSEVILQAGCWCRSALGKVEINAGWISFARDRCCLDLVRWKSALFGLGERKRMEGRRRVCTVCLGIWGEWWKKRKKKGEKRIYREREDTHGYGNRELDMVLRQWVPQKVQIFKWWEVENSVPNVRGLGSWGILSDEWGVMSDENWVRSDEWGVMVFLKPNNPLVIQVKSP